MVALVRARRDFAPAGDSLSCSCKKVSKEHGPDAQPLGFAKGSPPMLARLGRPETRCAHCVRSAQTVGPSLMRTRAGARCPAKLRFSAAHRGSSPNSRTAGKRRDEVRFGIRLLAAWLFGVPPMPSRGAQKSGPARVSALRALTWRNCLSGVSKANAASFAPGPALRAPQGTDRRRRAAQASGSPFFAFFLWRSKERRSAAGTTSRRALTEGSSPFPSNRRTVAYCTPRPQLHTGSMPLETGARRAPISWACWR